ncbi:MAG: sulfatase [Planctomycetes bacterium]|nr:sulfatase [Planctomycetota bacterium]
MPPSTTKPAAGLAALAATALCACSHAPKGPNVLLISIDSLRADHLSCYGYPRATTPAIDRIASEGMLFEQHMSSSSWTLPGHASLFTGLPDSIHGAFDTGHKLPDAAHTLAERFQAAGYATQGFFAGPYLHPAFGFAQGFDSYLDCASYASELDASAMQDPQQNKELNQKSHSDITNPTVYSAWQKWLAGRGEKPFFTFLHLWDVHFDYIPPAPFDKQFDPDYQGSVTGRNFFSDPSINASMPERDKQHVISLYDGEIAWTDSFVQKIREDLERAGLLENTILVITSDHGEELFDHGGKGHRMTLYDEVIHIPLVVRYPASLPKGARIHAQTASLDVLPTLLELAGLPAPTDVLGTSLAPFAHDPAAAHPRRAVSELASVGRNMRTVRSLEYKLYDDVARDAHYYFDLAQDPLEKSGLTDFETELGQRAVAGYTTEVQRMEAFLNAHPPQAQESVIPEGVRGQLEHFGYTEGESKQPAKAPPPK